ncbi:MAG: hypothetical protein HC836_38350 [Richelia sp. RM2_1_2]|nr:hypothetical protein [Richelia sp. RM2_1_2]
MPSSVIICTTRSLRVASFIGCSHQLLFNYLDGSITLEELLQPATNEFKSNEDLDFSPDTTAAWIKSLRPEEQMFLVFQGFQAFKERFDYLIEKKLMN